MSNEFAPLYVVQELSARCYAGCAGCFRNFVSGPRDGDMSREIFDATLAGIPPGTMILPQFHGESLLHPDLEYFLEEYKCAGLRVSMPASCGAGTKYIPALTASESPVYILILSVDGFCEHSQGVRRGKITLAHAEKFVEACLAARGERKSPWIAVRWVENGQSEREFELYLRKWLFDYEVDFVLRSRMFAYGEKTNSPTSLGSHRCRSLIEGNPVVLFNGDVLLCERVPDRERYVLGNVLRDSWPTLMARRAALIGDYPNEEPCKLCSAAYLLTGFKGIMELRHGEGKYSAPIYVHNDHSQTFYSLTREWSGINWSLSDRG